MLLCNGGNPAAQSLVNASNTYHKSSNLKLPLHYHLEAQF